MVHSIQTRRHVYGFKDSTLYWDETPFVDYISPTAQLIQPGKLPIYRDADNPKKTYVYDEGLKQAHHFIAQLAIAVNDRPDIVRWNQPPEEVYSTSQSPESRRPSNQASRQTSVSQASVSPQPSRKQVSIEDIVHADSDS
jgi:hypothetical protein